METVWPRMTVWKAGPILAECRVVDLTYGQACTTAMLMAATTMTLGPQAVEAT
jgi:hypothetical protein